MTDIEKDYHRLEDSLVDDELKYIKEIYNDDDEQLENLQFPLTFVIGYSNNLNNDNWPVHNKFNHYVYKPLDYAVVKLNVDEKKQVRSCAFMDEVKNQYYDLRSKNQTSSYNGTAHGFVRYIEKSSVHYHYESCAEITKDDEENKTLLLVRLNTSEKDIKTSIYGTNDYTPIVNVKCYFTCGNIVEVMGFTIKAKHARIHDLKAFMEDLSLGFSKCFIKDMTEIAFTDQIKDNAVWQTLLLHFRERLSQYAQDAAEQNGIKLNVRVSMV